MVVFHWPGYTAEVRTDEKRFPVFLSITLDRRESDVPSPRLTG